MLHGRSRQYAKNLVSSTRVRLVYNRITHTRFTTLYFFFVLFSCLVLCSLQGVLLADNTTAVNILSNAVSTRSELPPHITFREDGGLKVCDNIPSDHDSECSTILDKDGNTFDRLDTIKAFAIGNPLERRSVTALISHRDDGDDDDDKYKSAKNGTQTTSASSTSSVPSSIELPYSLTCVYSLQWLEDNLRDSQREDVATLFFQVYLFTIGLVAILNESLPHLGAAFFGHILGGAWSASRVQSTRTLDTFYRNAIVPGACEGTDLLGSWWQLRLFHTIPVVAASGVSIIALGFLSWKLLRVYHRRTLSRVGASPAVHRMYGLVLLFSVGLQLASFFTLVSAAIWIAKIAQGTFKAFAKHSKLYLAAFIVISAVQLPWLIIGWQCVRRECKIRTFLFIGISALFVAVSSVMFASNLYRCIFMTWQFFSTVTVTAFIFLVFTAALGVICFLNYGKGLKQYLEVTEALEGEDFTPVYFPRKDAKVPTSQLAAQYEDEKVETYNEKYQRDDIERALPSYQPQQQNLAQSKHKKQMPSLALSYASITRHKRGSSVYSDNLDSPIILSSSPPLISELAPPTPSMARRIKTRVSSWIASDVSSTKTDGNGAAILEVSRTANANSGRAGGGLPSGPGSVKVKTLVRPPPISVPQARISSYSMKQSPSPPSAFSTPGSLPSGASSEGVSAPRSAPTRQSTVPSLKGRESVRRTLKKPLMPGVDLPAVPTRF
ncbi:hypothetical protein DFP72DRAFT_969167 [Ephemerocybe angulata]|uniref:Uncharacterized protein n=1 Tax=Ephemerocybe angulata TaxID=980116 RepID=A0A8H6M3G6_9AGAR|nr:hypothetical protein DFP72DRAFT_969167 [Tulosesus angulatus]